MEIKMDRKEWRKRFKYRMDLSSRITHLTKGGDEDEAFDNLINILEEKESRGVRGKVGLYVEKSQQFVCKMRLFRRLQKIYNMKKC